MSSIRDESTFDASKLVQYIILRKDLLKAPYNYGRGSLAAQAAHAAVSCFAEYGHLERWKVYVSPEYRSKMHKCVLSVDNHESLDIVAARLDANNWRYVLWMEQPEATPTCIALCPYSRDELGNILSDLPLFR